MEGNEDALNDSMILSSFPMLKRSVASEASEIQLFMLQQVQVATGAQKLAAFRAIMADDPILLQKLLGKGVRIDVRNKGGSTLLELATERRRMAVLPVLRAGGVVCGSKQCCSCCSILEGPVTSSNKAKQAELLLQETQTADTIADFSPWYCSVCRRGNPKGARSCSTCFTHRGYDAHHLKSLISSRHAKAGGIKKAGSYCDCWALFFGTIAVGTLLAAVYGGNGYQVNCNAYGCLDKFMGQSGRPQDGSKSESVPLLLSSCFL